MRQHISTLEYRKHEIARTHTRTHTRTHARKGNKQNAVDALVPYDLDGCAASDEAHGIPPSPTHVLRVSSSALLTRIGLQVHVIVGNKNHALPATGGHEDMQ